MLRHFKVAPSQTSPAEEIKPKASAKHKTWQRAPNSWSARYSPFVNKDGTMEAPRQVGPKDRSRPSSQRASLIARKKTRSSHGFLFPKDQGTLTPDTLGGY